MLASTKISSQFTQICSSFTANFTLFFDYTYNGKEKDYESGFHYYGSRYYSSELSIWNSTDPMSDKYPSISPYTYCNNNPVLLIDPDGNEGKVSVAHNKNGGDITISSTIYITGKNCNQYIADFLNNAAVRFFKHGQYDDGKGNSYNIDFNIKFQYVEKNLPLYDSFLLFGENDFITRQEGDNILSFNGDVERSGVYYVGGHAGNISNDDINKSKSIFHEVMHFLGFSDRYIDKDNVSISHEGFENDIMGSPFGTISQKHYDSIGKYFSQKQNGEYLIKDCIDKNMDGTLK